MTPRTALDLDRCAEEPIRVPGAIQPHGRLLVLDGGTGRPVACSDNWPDEAELRRVADALAGDAARLVDGHAPSSLGRLSLGGRVHEVTGHRLAGRLLLEFEPSSPEHDGLQAPIYTLARDFLPRLQEATTVQSLVELAAREMKRLTGFGRCLVYRFDADDHGEVLAEAGDAGYESYLGHHFPASDVPTQARALYLQNQIRLIPDAHYQPVPLRALVADAAAQAIDLSFATLRSVSPVHLEYMRNMGTPASMSVSIVVRGRLWGLISCHDHAPRHLPLGTRVACEHLGRLLSLQIEAKEDNEEVARRLELRQLTLEIVSHLAESDGSLQQLVQQPAPLLRLARASGAAVVLDDECWTVGEAPSREQVAALSRWISLQNQEVVHTDRLPSVWPDAATAEGLPSGLLAISISQVHRHQILWFRPEVVQTLKWAGDPRRKVSDHNGRLHPRRSFSTWQEQVGGRSLGWNFGEVSAALELRQALIGIVLRRAEEMAEVATELGRVNKELEAFSYTVSHDLRAPMRHIAGYVDLVLDLEGGALSPRGHRYLQHVKEASVFAGHLVDALLDFSRMGRSALKRTAVDTNELVDDLVRQLRQQEASRDVVWDIAHPLPVLWADPFLLQVAVRNLLGNAVKYSRDRQPPKVRVRGVSRPEGDGLEISDNGVGFSMKYVGKLFGVFQRLHQSEEFEGTGIGLASVRRIVERHGGVVWAEGELDRGATFGFALPGRPQDG
jgi:light-regulated signal transduction histidine kinase (bacteriophytochrome)